MTDKMVQVLVFSEMDSENIGDQAIYSGLKEHLEGNGVNVEGISIERCIFYSSAWKVSLNPNSKAKEDLVNRSYISEKLKTFCKKFLRLVYLPIWALRQYFRLQTAIAQASSPDLAIIGGGGVIMNNNYHFPISILIFTIAMQRKKIPFGFAGVSTGGHLNAISKWMFSHSLKKAKFIFVRDKPSLHFVKELLNSNAGNVCLGPDYAFFNESQSFTYQDSEQISVAINITSNSIPLRSSEFRLHRKELLDLISALSNDLRFKVSIFTTGWPDDEIEKTFMINRLCERNVERLSNIDRPTSVSDLCGFLKGTHLVLCSRLHAGILGLLCGAQVLVIPYNKKTDNFMQSIDLCNADLGWPVNADSVYNCFLKMRHRWSSKQSQIVNAQRELSRETLLSELDRLRKAWSPPT